MKYFNTKEDYFKFIKNWKELANSGELKSRAHLFMIYNLLRDRDLYYGFSENTRHHSLFSINLAIDYEIRLCGYADKRSYLLRLFENVDIDSKTFLNDLKVENSNIIKKARDIESNINIE